jgi:hypothetical protein
MPSWKLGPDAASGRASTQLEYARKIRLAKASNAVHEALAAAAQAHFPQRPDRLPAVYEDLRRGAELPARQPTLTLDACLFLINTRQFDRTGFQFWQTFLRALPRGADTESVVGDLARAALGAAADDQLRTEVIMLLTANVDADDPGIRRRLTEALAPYRRPSECPLSYMMIRLFEITINVRLGEPVDFETACTDLADPRAKFVLQMGSIRHYTQIGDRVALKRTIDQLNAGLLVSPSFVQHVIPPLEALGMAEELRLAREAAGRELRKTVADSWARHDTSSGTRALDLAEILGGTDTLPAAWIVDMSSGSGDPAFQHRVLMTAALLRSDWAQVEKEAAVLNKDYPTHYHYFWYRGLASHKLGRAREAADALLTYVRYSKDELEYPKAIEILKTLGIPPP